MKVREEKIDIIYMDIVDIIGKNFDTSLPKATTVAEEICEKIEELIEEEYDAQ